MVQFYRPLTVAFSALRFELFGLNAVAHHVVSLVLFALAAALVGRLVLRVDVAAASARASSPCSSSSSIRPWRTRWSAWITNQMHLLQMLVLLFAIAVVGSPSAPGASPGGCRSCASPSSSFLIKEDGVMLLPAIIALHEIRRRTIEPGLRAVPVMFVVLSALAIAALIAVVRMLALGEFGGYGRPTLSTRPGTTSRTTLRRRVSADSGPPRRGSRWRAPFATFLPLAAVAAWPWISTRSALLPARRAPPSRSSSPADVVFGTKPEQVYTDRRGILARAQPARRSALFDLARARAGSPRSLGWRPSQSSRSHCSRSAR